MQPQSTNPVPVQSTDYTSNPFEAVSKGLGKTLSVNPTSALSVVFYALLLGAAFGVIAAILVLLPGPLKFLGFIVALVGYVAVILRGYAAAIKVTQLSKTNERTTGLKAFKDDASVGFWPFVGTTLLTGIITAIGFIVLIVPGVILGARLLLAPYVSYAEGLGAVAAMRRSWELTKGHTWEMLGLYVATVATGGLSGGLLLLATSTAGIAIRYDELSAAQKAQADTGKVHWLNYVAPIVAFLFFGGYIALIAVAAHSGSKSDPYSTGSSSLYNTKNPETQSGKTYCYYPTDSSDPKVDCVDKASCQKTSDCADLYFSNSSDMTSGTDSSDGSLTQ